MLENVMDVAGGYTSTLGDLAAVQREAYQLSLASGRPVAVWEEDGPEYTGFVMDGDVIDEMLDMPDGPGNARLVGVIKADPRAN